MIDTRLVLFDGIAGAGKTTLAQWLYLQLGRSGVDAQWIPEDGRDHPIYAGADQAPSIDEAFARAIANWRRFAEDRADRSRVSIFDGALIDKPVAFLLLEDAPRERIVHIVLDVVDAVRSLRPVLFHLVQDDVDRAIETIAARRGDRWRDHLVAYVSASPFAHARRLSGLDAPRVYYREVRAIADEVFGRLDVSRVALGTSGDRWDDCRRRIAEVLDVSIPPPAPPSSSLPALVGDYRDEASGRIWRIDAHAGGLFLEGARPIRLLPIDDDRYFLEGLPIELRFERPAGAAADRVHYTSESDDGLDPARTWVRCPAQVESPHG